MSAAPSPSSSSSIEEQLPTNLANAIDGLDDAAVAARMMEAASSSSSSSSPNSSSSTLPHQYQSQQYELAPPLQDSTPPPTMMTLSIGQDCGYLKELLPKLHQATQQYFEFIVVPLGAPLSSPSSPHVLSLTSPDTLMCATQWSRNVVGSISEWIILDDVYPTMYGEPSFQQRLRCEHAFEREMSWACHLGLPAVMVRLPRSLPGSSTSNTSRFVGQALEKTQTMQMWMVVPLMNTNPIDLNANVDVDDGAVADDVWSDDIDSWKNWNRIRNSCENHRRLGVALELTMDLPEEVGLNQEEEEDSIDLTQHRSGIKPESCIMDRWLGEPIRAVIVSTEIFTVNKKGYPILSQRHQTVIKRLFELKDVKWILRDDGSNEETILTSNFTIASSSSATPSNTSNKSSPSSHDLQPYQYYLRHLFKQFSQQSSSHSQRRRFEQPYDDLLQIPLQPLSEHLESSVYEVFEKDPIKYAKYEEAIGMALKDLQKRWLEEASKKLAKGDGGSNDPLPINQVAAILVVGAGRGPLIRCALRASSSTGVPVKVYGLEKNPNAIETLKTLVEHDPSFEGVEIIHADMRSWEGPNGVIEFADLLVSELLGSFGDNELSPECLDGALKFLKSKTGISIPQDSVSYLVPVSSTKLWKEVDLLNGIVGLKEGGHMETPYVVRMKNHWRMSPTIKSVFKFVHHTKKNEKDENNNTATAAAAVDDGANGAGVGIDDLHLTEGGWTDVDGPYQVDLERYKQRVMFEQEKVYGRRTTSSASSPPPPSSNSRHTSLTFDIPLSGTLHGFGGYFTSKLYGEVELSILPGSRFSEGMFSWFPIFFPIRVRRQTDRRHGVGWGGWVGVGLLAATVLSFCSSSR